MKQQIAEIALSSSGDESSSSLDESYSSSSSASLPWNKKGRKRKVVKPPVFTMNGKGHLKDFSISFEIYFDKQFDGSSYDKTQELANFLSDELLQVYSVQGGRKLKYRHMKERLLNWYQKQRIGSKTYWRRQLDETTPNGDESLDIFGMRLQEISELAFLIQARSVLVNFE